MVIVPDDETFKEYEDRVTAAVDNIPFAIMDLIKAHLVDLPVWTHPLVMTIVARKLCVAIEQSTQENLSPLYRAIIDVYSERNGIGVELRRP